MSLATASVATVRRVLPRIASSALLPTGLVCVIAAADAALRRWDFGVVPFGLIDWSAHLSTAALVLLAAAGPRWLVDHPRFSIAALSGSVLIDLDHLALYAGLPVAVGGGRPFPHSLMTPLLLGAGWLLTGRRSVVLGGLTVGVLLHFVRDIATGPGLVLWWPFDDTDVLLPYGIYAAAVLGCAVVATVRARRLATVQTRTG